MKCTRFWSWIIIYHPKKKHLNINVPLAGYGDYRKHEELDATDAESASLRKPVVQRRRQAERRSSSKEEDTRNVFMNLASEQVFHVNRWSRRHDRSAMTFLENSRCSYETKSQSTSAFLVQWKKKRNICYISFFFFLTFDRVLRVGVFCCSFEYAILQLHTTDSLWRHFSKSWIKYDSSTTSGLESCFWRTAVEPNCN